MPLARDKDGRNTNVELNAMVNIKMAKHNAKNGKFFNNENSMKGVFFSFGGPCMDFLTLFHCRLNSEGLLDSILTAAVMSIEEACFIAVWSCSSCRGLSWDCSMMSPFKSCLLASTSAVDCLRLFLIRFLLKQSKADIDRNIIEPPHGKTNNLHMRKQRRRSASQ